jgi:hypothetical protein
VESDEGIDPAEIAGLGAQPEQLASLFEAFPYVASWRRKEKKTCQECS